MKLILSITLTLFGILMILHFVISKKNAKYRPPVEDLESYGYKKKMDLKVPTDKSKYEKTSRSFTHSYKVKRSLKLSTKPKHETKTWKHGTTISTQSPIKEILSESLVNETSIPAIGKNAPIPRQNSTADISQTDLKMGYKSLDQYSTPTADYNSWNVKKFDPSNIKSTSRKILSSETESKLERVSEKDNFIQPDIDILNDFTEIPKPSKLVFLDKKNDQKKFTRNFKYDPALIMMGLGKRSKQSITTSGLNRLSNDESILKQIGLGNVNYDHKSMLLGKRSSTYDPALKYMGLGKRNNIYDPALQFTGLDKREDSNTMPLKKVELEKRQKVYDPALNYMGLGKKKSYDPALKYMGLGKRLSSYDPALKFMGLGKRKSSYNPALKYMDLGKRESAYDPALRYMGLGKKSDYDPALKYMGLGKKSDYDPALGYMGLGKKFDYDPALRYMGLGKKSSYDPALKYMGLGKKSDYDPALRYMGLGKKSDYDPALRYMGLGKKSSYDPALKYMGLGKKSDYDPALRYMGLGKKSDYDPALRYMGLGKKSSYDPALKYMGLGKKSDYDPALRYMGLGKKSDYDPALRYMGLGKKSSYDPALKYMGLGKKSNYDPALRYMGLGKKSDYDPALRYMGLGKKSSYDPALKYMGLGKKSDYDPALRYMGLGKKSDYDPALRYMGLGKKSSYDPALKYMGLGKKSDYDPALRYMGLGKKSDYDPALRYMGLGKKSSYDPALKFMGLGKRQYKYDPAMKYLGLGKRVSSETKANGLIQKTIQDNPTGNEYITKTKSQKNKNTPQHENYSPNKEAHSNDDPAFKNLGLDKKDFSYDRTLDFMSKRQSKVKEFDSDDKDELSNLVSVNDNYNDELYQSFVFTPFIGTSQKKNPKFDPALNFMGLGKRINTSNQPSKITSLGEKFLKHELVKSFLNPIQDDYKIVNHKFQPFLKSLMNSSLKIDCIKCNPTDRHKRSLAGFEQFNTMDLDKTEAKNGFANVKRDYYNRPKYNPGWIFIGLGKRSSLLQEPLINYDAYETESTRAGKKIAPQIVFDKYYDLLCTIQKSIEEIQNDLKNKNKLSVSEKNLEKPDTISELGVNWYRIPYGNYAYINDDPNESHLRKPEEKDVVWSQIQPPFGTDTHVINT